MKLIVIGGGCYGIYHSEQLYKAILKGKLPADTRLIIVDRNARPPALEKFGNAPQFEFVQSDWQEYLQKFFADSQNYSPEIHADSVQIVPAPFAPHLLFDWLQFATTQRLLELGHPGIVIERNGFEERTMLPYEYFDPKSGNRYISRAGWKCPTACIEPHKCPAIKDVRDWDLEEDVKRAASGKLPVPSSTAAQRLNAENKPNCQPLPNTASNPLTFDAAITFTCRHFSHGIGTTPAHQLFEARKRAVALALSLTAEHPVAHLAIATVSHCHGVLATLKISFHA
ncbi:MAG: hypothetical protein HXX08_09595 [Chloroflexi bacterium]|uniref:Uncharacterized protein n=1 Tax=Candidatus Chlorohelix allophototropha TaxID=3003348 RepID=A0A8T7M1Q0_9CHLR|nr:hypothetical protein [Chloroflexota bacterium]WJW65498.1 hypothetical protein OZ401_001263 [Chloroflexota bacterium L227-S17]